MNAKSNETRWVVFDAEANGLRPDKFYCVSFHDHEGNKGTLLDYEDIRSFFLRYEMYVGHNIRRWDIPNLRRVVGCSCPSSIVDTLAVRWYLDPEESDNGLEDIGEDFGVSKPIVSDWTEQPLEVYVHRCEQDVEINVRLWKDQLRRLLRVYKDSETLNKFLRYLDFKMYSAALAEESGWRLDVDRVKKSLETLTPIRDQKFAELKAAMPGVPIVHVYKPPKRFYNADGQPSLLAQRWYERLDDAGVPRRDDGTLEVITGYDEPNPGSTPQIKEWLFSLGWVPQTIKIKRNKKTGVETQTPQIYLERQKGGGVCPSVKLLYEKEPRLEVLDGLSIVKHRITILNGFLRDCSDGYLRACVAGLTNTLRFKHAEIVNLPKVEVPYGADIRGPLIASDDEHELCGSDCSSLEDRIKQHFLWKHDPDYVSELNRPDYDPHLDLALHAGALTLEQVQAYKLVDKTKEEERPKLDPKCILIFREVKPVRAIYKNGNYACQYGAGVSRLAITCGCSLEVAKGVHEAYWKRNWAIKAVVDEQVVKTVDGQMWLYNPVSGFWYTLRYKKDIFSTLVQGTAAYVFDKYLAHVLLRRPQVTGQFHDEFILNVKKGNREAITKFLNDVIREVNEELKLNRELGISVQFGDSYADIH